MFDTVNLERSSTVPGVVCFNLAGLSFALATLPASLRLAIARAYTGGAKGCRADTFARVVLAYAVSEARIRSGVGKP